MGETKYFKRLKKKLDDEDKNKTLVIFLNKF